MDGSSCGFDRVRSHPAKIIKGAKKAAYYPKMRYFLPTAQSFHEVLTVAQLDKADAACAKSDAARPI